MPEIPTKAALLARKLGIDGEALQKLHACANDRYGAYFPTFLRIRDKDKRIVPFQPTRIHKKFIKHRRKLNYAVKSRQIFKTSFCIADNFTEAVQEAGTKCLFINLDGRTTEEVFERAHGFYDNFPVPALLPQKVKDRTRKLSFTNDSSLDAVTARNSDGPDAAKALGRSCTYQRVHVTECAYMRYYREFLSGMLDSLPRNGYAVFESTGNGPQGGWYEDIVEIIENGTSPEHNIWVLGDKMVQFSAYWEHFEYFMDSDPLLEISLNAAQQQALEQSEQDHLVQMRKDTELSEEDRQRALYWRRWMLLNKKGFLRDHTTALRDMDREYPPTWRHAFASTGSAFLSLSLTDARREEWKRANLEDDLPLHLRLVRAGSDVMVYQGNQIQIWAPPYDRTKEAWIDRYCIGADVGGGNPDSDPDCIWVKDRLKNQYVAVAHGTFGADKSAELMQALGYWYHGARLAWEANNHGVGVSIALWKAEYPNLYAWNPDLPEYQGLGFQTNGKSRNQGLQYLKTVYEDRSNPLLVPYVEFYREAAAFAPPADKPDGKVEGQGNTHDDTVMALMVCEMCDASMPPPEKVVADPIWAPGTIGHIRTQAMTPSGKGLSNYA